MKNEIEQDLDEKEFENELGRDLNSQYNQLNSQEKLMEGKNRYVIGALHFIYTMVFFEVLYWLISTLSNSMSLGYTVAFFDQLSPFIHVAIFIMAVYSAYSLKSPIIYVLKLMPNGWSSG